MFLGDHVRRNASGFVDRRQTAARMGAPTYQITVVQFFEFIVRPPVEHLAEFMRQAEGRAFINIFIRFPSLRRNDSFAFDMFANVG